MNKKENQNDSANFSKQVEKKIQEALSKGNKEKQVAEPKPKSGKGL